MGYQSQRETTTGDTLVFAVNGERFQLSDVNPNTTLLEFLRTQTRFKSVKLGCGEGGCGACVVLLSKYYYELDQVEDITVSSCLTLLCSINGCSITTSEGLGNSKTGFHPIHQRFTGFHASQCGFCTPGICVSLFSALVNAEKTNRPEPPPGFSKLTTSEAEKAVAGNLCRCTGYRPIADVCKSFAADVDIEDLGLNSYWGKEESKEEKISKLPLYKHANEICTYPEFLRKEKEFRSCRWQSPVSIEELQSLLPSVEANSPTSFKLVVGNTGSGYYKDVEDYDKYIDIRHIAELSEIKRDHTGIEIGTTVTISRAVEALRVATKDEFQPEGGMVFKKIADHMDKIGSGFLRNSASIGGNLVMAQRKNFPSDMTTVLLAVGAMVEIMSGHKFEKLTLEEFLQRPPMDSRSVLLRLKIPRINTTSETNTLLMFETYRAAPRPLGNALPYLNAAFLAEISPSKSHDGVSVRNCRLALGAFGTKHSIRAKKVEEYLKGKVLNLAVLYEATKLLSATVVPENGTSYPAYRSSLAAGFLFEFFGFLTETKPKIPRNGSCGDSNIMLSKVLKMKEDNNEIKFPGLLSSSKQAFQLSGDYYPVGKPITKSGANLQASGEAIYVDDIPSPTNCLYGAFLYSTKPLARVNGIEYKSKSLPNGFKALITFKDIPGENIGLKTIFATEPLFADELTVSAGQLIGIVVADTQKNADRAADLAVVNYDVENLEPPILTVEEAVEKSSFFEVPSFIYPKQIGDISKGMEEADHKIISAEIKLGSQYYFYMETHAALAVPDEDNCMVVYSASQVPEYAHVTISKCLGIPEHSVRVITRRLGGGFGGKAMKSMPVATACALAAYKVQRPVKIYVNRKTDMITVGGRHPMKVTYTVGFKSSGKITALQLEILIDAGWSADVSPMIPKNILGTLRKYDFGALHFDIKVCKTNRPSRSAMRGPGEVQASFIGEAVIEHVASYLSMEADSVRQINFHSYDSLKFYFEGVAGEQLEYTLPSIWEKLNLSSDFNQRTELVKEFNESNIWRKRGISRVPTIHEVVVRPTPGRVSILRDGSVVVGVGGIELGQGLWTKVKQMAAFGLGLVKCGETKDLIDKVRVVQSDTLSMIQGGFTAGSTTSEQSCEAVRLCCLILVERLTPVSERLIQQMGSISWETLIHQAYLETVNLSASSYFVADLASMEYLNYGAAVSEVEVNLLTGETTILRSDIIYDCGQSLNPAVDLGQIEGAFVQGIGYFMHEEYPTNSEGLVLSHGTWSYKIPTMDTIPKQLRVEVLNSGHHQKRVLSSKASGEPPLLLAVSVHCATRAAIEEARRQRLSWGCVDATDPTFQLGIPATMPVVKELAGLDSLEKYLSWRMNKK